MNNISNGSREGFESIKWDYLLIFLLIANSAIPFFFLYIEFKIINLVIVSVIFFLRKRTGDKFIMIYLLLLFIVTAGQLAIFRSFIFQDVLSVAIRILIAYLTVKTVMLKFFPVTRNIIYYLALLSFFFYIPSILFPSVRDYLISLSPNFNPPFYDELQSSYRQLVLFNFDEIEEYRNSGPFWEAGTFAGFLIIGLIINSVMTRKLFEPKSLVMIIALFTTLSTTGYIVFFLFIMIYFIYINRLFNPVIIVLPSILAFIIIFSTADFLQDKLVTQISQTEHFYKYGAVGNRFVSALVDINDFLRYPIFGKGYTETTHSSKFTKNRTNGIASHLANFGIIFFTFYFVNMYISFLRFCSLYSQERAGVFLFALLIIIGFSELYYNHPFFYALTMLQLAIPIPHTKLRHLKLFQNFLAQQENVRSAGQNENYS